MIKKIICVFSAVMLLSFGTMQALASSQIQDAENKKDKLEDQISNIKTKEQLERQKLNWNKQQKEKIMQTLKDKGLKEQEIKQQVDLLDAAVKSLDVSITQAEQDYLTQQELLKARLAVLYKNSKSVYFLEELLNCDDLNEFFTKVKMMSALAASDKRLMEQIKNSQQEIEILKSQKEQEIEDFLKTAENNRREIDQLEVSRAKIEQDIKKNQDKVWYYINQEDELLKISKDLENLIKNLKVNSGSYVGGTMVWPVPVSRRIASYYGMRLHPIYKVWKMHTGVDLSANYNNYIVAANTGTVIYAGWRGGYGNTVIIDHGGGITTLYAHINTNGILVRLGTKVDAGQTIAKIGSTGLSTGPHLHFEVRKNGETQDPLKYVSMPK